MSAETAPDWRRTVRRRALVLLALLGVWAVAVEARLWVLQVVERDALRELVEQQRMRTVRATPRRGLILDRQGRVLAQSVDEQSVWADPGAIGDPAGTTASLCRALGDCTTRERQALERALGRSRSGFAWVRRLPRREQVERVLALGLTGVYTVSESRRYYPSSELAAPLLGYVGHDGQGLAGIERTYDRQISGTPGEIVLEVDARRRAFGRVGRPAQEGATLELTIDLRLQARVEQELEAAVAHHRADGGVVVVMAPDSGEILAMASAPTFDPNLYQRFEPDRRRNRAVQDTYEPGSTLKIVTAAAAFDEHVIRPSDLIDVRGGAIRIGSRVVEDTHAYGTLTFTDVLVKSSNVGAIKAGLRIGSERLGRYVRRFGLGRRLSPDFPEENAGLVYDPSRWSESTLASVAMGYEISVSPLQMAAVVSAVANGGEVVQPRVVRAIADGRTRTVVPPKVIGRAISTETAAELTSIMEEVVSRGTATTAKIPGYTVAGKTGTARKVVDGVYARGLYHSSFVGFAPSRRPAITVVVVIDTPRSGAYYGGLVAAPLFKRVAEITLQHLGIGPTVNPLPPVIVPPAADRMAVRTAVADGPPSLFIAPPLGPDGRPVVPDLTGFGAREAVQALTRMGLTVTVQGAGIVESQSPPPGTPIVPGEGCRLSLARSAGRVPPEGSAP